MIVRVRHKLECPKCGGNKVSRSPRMKKERFVLFLTASLPYRCSNCRYRFYVRDRRQLTELYALWGILLLVVIGTVAYFSYRQWPVAGQATARTHGSKVVLRPKQEPVRPGELQNPSQAREAALRHESPATAVQFASHQRYGVNWEEMEEGLRITHLRGGPLREAGLKKGDVIVTMNGRKATDNGMLKARDDIISGLSAKARFTVRRDKEYLSYELQK